MRDGFIHPRFKDIVVVDSDPVRLLGMPQADALRDSSYFFHEIIGLAWYRLKSALH